MYKGLNIDFTITLVYRVDETVFAVHEGAKHKYCLVCRVVYLAVCDN